MADGIAAGQRIANVMGHPPATYLRPAGGVSVAPVPFYLVQGDCEAGRVYLIAGSTVSSEASARLKVYVKRGATIISLYDALIPGWAALTEITLSSPGTVLQKGDILVFQVTPALAQVMPELLIGVDLELF